MELTTDFSFTPGRYVIELIAFLHGEVTDHVPGAMDFEVKDGNFFGNGRKPWNSSAMHLKTQWTLR